MPTQLAVLGRPIAHSRSPQIHRAAYERLGLPWKFSAIRVDAPALRQFTDGRGEEWRGLSCTMPLKEQAFAIAEWRDPAAQETGAVNTLLRLPGEGANGAPRWAGFNTDVPGLAAAIRKAGLNVERSVVLGAGATAASAILALRMLGAEHITVLARRSAAATELAQRFDGSREPQRTDAITVSSASLDDDTGRDVTAVVSTLPGPAGQQVSLHPSLLRAPLFDVAYDPWPSPLAERWAEAGTASHDGLGMLIEQALIQLRIFVGGDPRSALPDEAALLAHLYNAGMGG